MVAIASESSIQQFDKAVRALSLRSSLTEVQSFIKAEKQHHETCQELRPIRIRVGEKSLDFYLTIPGGLSPDDPSGLGPNQHYTFGSDDVNAVLDTIAIRLYNEQKQHCETVIALSIGQFSRHPFDVLWLFDRQHYALLFAGYDEERWYDRATQLEGTDIRLSFADLDGNPFSSDGAQLGKLWKNGFTAEFVGFHPSNGIHIAEKPDKLLDDLTWDPSR